MHTPLSLLKTETQVNKSEEIIINVVALFS